MLFFHQQMDSRRTRVALAPVRVPFARLSSRRGHTCTTSSLASSRRATTTTTTVRTITGHLRSNWNASVSTNGYVVSSTHRYIHGNVYWLAHLPFSRFLRLVELFPSSSLLGDDASLPPAPSRSLPFSLRSPSCRVHAEPRE